ncbi:hypothetical protein [Aeoliella sp.]|uniref:hypothetical protein n=1 Tax=Aeoliella sp. TaxID=2795800 RepID=UPI003CCC0457
MSRSPYSLCLGATLLLIATGCQRAAPEPAADPSVAAPIAEAKPATIEPSVDPRQVLREAMASYVAPYPGRSDLFVPPKDAPQQARSVSDGNVQLRGLVDLGEPRAILDIEGATALVPVGQEKYGVKVVSIDGDEVTLERGQTKWTASLD